MTSLVQQVRNKLPFYTRWCHAKKGHLLVFVVATWFSVAHQKLMIFLASKMYGIRPSATKQCLGLYTPIYIEM